MKFIKEYSWCLVTGASLVLAGWGPLHWQFYLAAILIGILEDWSKH